MIGLHVYPTLNNHSFAAFKEQDQPNIDYTSDVTKAIETNLFTFNRQLIINRSSKI